MANGMSGYYGHDERNYIPDFSWVAKAGGQIGNAIADTGKIIEASQARKHLEGKADVVKKALLGRVNELTPEQQQKYIGYTPDELESLLEVPPNGDITDDFMVIATKTVGKGLAKYEKAQKDEVVNKIRSLSSSDENVDDQNTLKQIKALAQWKGVFDDERVQKTIKSLEGRIGEKQKGQQNVQALQGMRSVDGPLSEQVAGGIEATGGMGPIQPKDYIESLQQEQTEQSKYKRESERTKRAAISGQDDLMRKKKMQADAIRQTAQTIQKDIEITKDISEDYSDRLDEAQRHLASLMEMQSMAFGEDKDKIVKEIESVKKEITKYKEKIRSERGTLKEKMSELQNVSRAHAEFVSRMSGQQLRPAKMIPIESKGEPILGKNPLGLKFTR